MEAGGEIDGGASGALAAALEFTDADLAANRSGQLSVAQRGRMELTLAGQRTAGRS